MSEQQIHSVIRDQFEDYAYRQYEASRMAVMLTHGPEAMDTEDRAQPIPRHVYCAVHLDGTYKREALTMMWIGWKLCLDACAPLLEAADLWRQWTQIQDRAARELPLGYEIRWSIDKFDPAIDGSGLAALQLIHWDEDNEGRALEYEDPADQDSPGLFTRYFELALQAAKDHYARWLN